MQQENQPIYGSGAKIYQKQRSPERKQLHLQSRHHLVPPLTQKRNNLPLKHALYNSRNDQRSPQLSNASRSLKVPDTIGNYPLQVVSQVNEVSVDLMDKGEVDVQQKQQEVPPIIQNNYDYEEPTNVDEAQAIDTKFLQDIEAKMAQINKLLARPGE